MSDALLLAMCALQHRSTCLASAVVIACLLSDTRVASLAPSGRSLARAAVHHRRAGPVLRSVPDVAHDAPTTSRAGVTLVGAGPGDPDLLTVAALRLIEEPGALVIADRLISSEVLALVQGELRIARKTPGCAEQAQNEIYEWVAEGVASGRHVIRLKIGDPFVFGRGGEEILEFRKLLGGTLVPRVVPGVSAAFAAPLLGGIPVTHRGAAHRVVMSTGFGRNCTSPELPSYDDQTTTVFLMAVGRLPELCTGLQERGYPSSCAAAVIERAGCPDMRVLVGSVGTIARLAAEHEMRPPSTIIFGDVVRVVHGDFEGLCERVGGSEGIYWSGAGALEAAASGASLMPLDMTEPARAPAAPVADLEAVRSR